MSSSHLGPYDVAIIGAGVVGCAVAQSLSRFELSVVLIEGSNDIATGTSKANSAILHTGFDAPVGSLEAELVSQGHTLLTSYARQVGIPLQRVGAHVIAWSAEDVSELSEIETKARANGYDGTRPLAPDQMYNREPRLARGVHGAIEVPDESIICPFTTPLALATDAVRNGVNLQLSSPVKRLDQADFGGWVVATPTQNIEARWVVNAAGLRSDEIEAMVGPTEHRVTPRRGEFVIFDKTASSLVSSIILPVPTPKTKGVLIAPTVFGNVLLGPTAEDLEDKTDTRTTHSGITHLIAEGDRVMPGINDFEITSTYAGLRAVGPAGYEIDADGSRRYAWAYGIRSTGLSASMAIAERLVQRLADEGLPVNEKPSASIKAVDGLNYLGEDADRRFCNEAGRVVCFCEKTTLADLEAAVASDIPPSDLEGLWRRTRALGGRCQGFYCRTNVTRWFETKISARSSGRVVD